MAPATSDSEGKIDWKSQKIQQAKKRKLENSLKKTEEEIETLEQRNEELDTLMALPENCCDAGKLAKLAREKEENVKVLETLYESWETLSSELEN